MHPIFSCKALKSLDRMLWREKYRFIFRKMKVSEQELDYLFVLREAIDTGALKGVLPLHMIRTVLVERGAEVDESKILAELYFCAAKICMATPFHLLSKKYFIKSLEFDKNMTVHAMYLNVCVSSPDETNESLFKKAIEFGSIYGNAVVSDKKHRNSCDPKKVLKVGYVCSFFDNTVMRNAMLPTLAGHDRRKLEIHCFSSGKIPQDMLSAADYWHDCQTLNNFQLACLIRDLEIDILRDLDGFIENNRLGMFAMKPSPIQVQGANYLATSGLPFFNWIITSEDAVPLSEDQYYTEKIYRNSPLLHFASVPSYLYVDYFPDPAPPPIKNNAFVTFGYFGAGHKVNERAIKLWCKVLKLVPSSRFIFKCSYNQNPETREVYAECFRKYGVNAERLELRLPSSYDQMLLEYGDVDIALDSFPYTGGSTMNEALWMGVPVLSIKGERKASRSGAALLNLVGLSDLVAHDEEDFVYKAVSIGLDKERVITLRTGLRDRLRAKDYYDRNKFCQEMENAYREIWVTWCNEAVQQENSDIRKVSVNCGSRSL